MKLFLGIFILLFLVVFSFYYMLHMPGKSIKQSKSETSTNHQSVKSQLKTVIEHLASKIGTRSIAQYDALLKAEDYLYSELKLVNYEVKKHQFMVDDKQVTNLIVEQKGTEPGFYIIGAHYDSVPTGPGANDNASGIAALLYLARQFKDKNLKYGVRFVFFVNEEPPYFQSDKMGSFVYANTLTSEKAQILGMISFDTIGYYSNESNSQFYPFPFSLFYPNKGNFIGFISNLSSKPFMKKALTAFREKEILPSEGAAVPTMIPGISWSDHWSFWQIGIPAFMITDTAPYRYPYYHLAEDTLDKINFDEMTKAVLGIEHMLFTLCLTTSH